jgi:F-type H+-transporting ATPase subunit b
VEAENAKKESFQRLIEAENKRMEAYEEAQKIIDNSNMESNYKFDEIVNKAKSDAFSIQKNADEEAKQLLKDLNQTNNKKIVSIAMLASKEILKRNINKKDNEKIVNNFIKNFKKESEA